MSIIELKNIKKSFGDLEVLKGVNLTVEKGQVIAIIGPSGSGKSTLLRILNYLEEPTSGQVLFEGNIVEAKRKHLYALRSQVGMVFQSFNLFPHQSVLDNIILTPKLMKKIPELQAKDEALDLLHLVGLSDKALAYPGQLSGGKSNVLLLLEHWL